MKKKEIEMMVDGYFGNHKFEKEVSMVGSIAYIRISYYDFKTESMVRNELERLIPMSKVEIVERLFSDDVKSAVLMKMMDDGVEIIVNEGDGVFRKVPLYIAVEERLFVASI